MSTLWTPRLSIGSNLSKRHRCQNQIRDDCDEDEKDDYVGQRKTSAFEGTAAQSFHLFPTSRMFFDVFFKSFDQEHKCENARVMKGH